MWGGKNIFRNITLVKDIFSSLHSRNYRLFFTGQGISLIGTWMQNVALSWLVYRLTGSVLLLGVVGFTSQIPSFVLSPFTGVITDRFNKIKIITLTQISFMLHALLVATLVLFQLIEVWHIIALSVLFGIITAFDTPARQSLVINLIDDPKDLGNAIALNSALFNSGRLIGPAIAGIVIAIVGEGICFLINAASFIAVIAALQKIKIPHKKPSAISANFKKSFFDGVHYTFQSVPIRMLIILLALLSVISLSFIVLLPAYAKEVLHGKADTLGYLMSALGAGALCGALYMASRKTVIGLGRLLALGIPILGLAVIAASFSGNLFFSLPAFFAGGIFMVISLSSINTMLQTIADEDKRGRVMSFYAMALMGMTPIGNLLAGIFASKIGLTNTFLLSGIITVLSGFWFGMNLKSLRRYVRPIYVHKGILPHLPDN